MKKVEIISPSADGTVFDFQTQINSFLRTLGDEHEVGLQFIEAERTLCAIVYEPKKIEDSLLMSMSYFIANARDQSIITGSQEAELLSLLQTKFQKT